VVLVDGLAQVPSLVARIVSVTASPPLFEPAMKSQVAWESWKTQLFGTDTPRVSEIGTHLASTRTSVAAFMKSSSKNESAVPCVKCTSIWPRFGGRSTPLGG